MKRVLIAAVTLIVVILAGALFVTVREVQEERTQRQALQSEMDAVLDGLVVQDKVAAYFARVWPDIHIMRVRVTETQGAVTRMEVQVLAGNDTLSIRCHMSDGAVEHNLDEVLFNRTGVLLVPVSVLANEPGATGNIVVNAPQGMRAQILNISGEWAKVLIDGKEGYMPLALFSLRPASFTIRPFSKAGHNSQDRAGTTPDALLRRYFAAYISADFDRVADLQAHYPQPTRLAYVRSLAEARESGYRIWGYEVMEHLMISANEAAVLVRYTWTSILGRTVTSTDWWRALKVDGVWKVAWFPRE